MYTLRIYSPEAFEWDPAKQASNLWKHGVDFKDAVRVFDRPVVEREDGRRNYGEVRLVALGTAADNVLAVVYTPRGSAFRVISARKANRHEKAAYREIHPARGGQGAHRLGADPAPD